GFRRVHGQPRGEREMKIAVIGTGRMGTGLASGFAKAGHDVVFGSRDTSSAAEDVQEAGAAGAVAYGEAAAGRAREVGFDPVEAASLALPRLLGVMGALKLGPDRPLKILQR